MHHCLLTRSAHIDICFVCLNEQFIRVKLHISVLSGENQRCVPMSVLMVHIQARFQQRLHNCRVEITWLLSENQILHQDVQARILECVVHLSRIDKLLKASLQMLGQTALKVLNPVVSRCR